jgi:hypothetical protein
MAAAIALVSRKMLITKLLIFLGLKVLQVTNSSPAV